MSRYSIGTLRAIAAEKGYAIEPSRGHGRYRLIRLDIGHAVMNPETGHPTFSLKEAIMYLRRVEDEAEEA